MSHTAFISTISNKLSVIYKSISSLSERRIVSKPQALSKLRYVNIIKNSDETALERTYRLQYESLQNWNDKYWSENNKIFDQEKSEYIKRNFGELIAEDEALSHDQLAPFYRSFLERNRKKHMDYNIAWYQSYASLLASSVRAKISRIKSGLSTAGSDT